MYFILIKPVFSDFLSVLSGTINMYFVYFRAFFDKKKSAQEKITLLKRACDIHQNMYRDAMNGKAIDRHLFALYVVSKGMSYVSI